MSPHQDKREEVKAFCPEHGLPLELSYEKNRYRVGMHHMDGGIVIGEDFDTKTGEPLYCIVGRCPVKNQNGLKTLLRMPQESHYIHLIKSDAKRSTPPHPSENDA